MDAACAKCGNAFSHTPTGPGRPRKYCDDCRRIDVRRGRYVPAIPRPACVVCGTAFRDVGANRKYCSSACKWLARKANDGIPCELCGEPTGWTKASGKVRATHKACAPRPACGTMAAYRHGCRCESCRSVKREHNRTFAPPSKPLAVRQCRECGVDFNPRSNQVLCSPACRKINLGRFGTHKSRADHWGVEYRVVERRDIFERDNWTCGICELPVDPRAAFPDPGAATLDHVVPMSQGGAHIESNLQCAHFYCNTVKGNRIEMGQAC